MTSHDRASGKGGGGGGARGGTAKGESQNQKQQSGRTTPAGEPESGQEPAEGQAPSALAVGPRACRLPARAASRAAALVAASGSNGNGTSAKNSRQEGQLGVEWVEVTAKTVEEAKEEALDQLGVDESEAEFEVLEEPKAGLFGRLRSEARVRARGGF